METANNSSAQYQKFETHLQPGWFAVACLVCGVVGLLSNVLVLAVLIEQCKRKPYTKRYSLSLALGNLIYSIGAICTYVQAVVADITQAACTLYITIDYFGYYVCVSSLVLLALERLCAIRFPMYFRKLTSLKNVRIQVTLVWFICALVTIYPASAYKVSISPKSGNSTLILECFPEPQNAMKMYDLVFDMILPVLLFTGLTVFTIIMVKKRSTVAVAGGSVRNGDTGNSLKKSCLYLTFIAAMFSLCFGSYFIYTLIPLIAPRMASYEGMHLTSEIVQLLTFWHTWFNPIMHLCCDANFRNGLRRLVCCKRQGMTEVSRETALKCSNAQSKT